MKATSRATGFGQPSTKRGGKIGVDIWRLLGDAITELRIDPAT